MKKFNKGSVNVLAISGVVGFFVLITALAIYWSKGPMNTALLTKTQLAAAVAADLLSTDNFAVLAGSTITNTGISSITGDLGLSPGLSVTGFPPGVLVGTQHVSDATAIQAKTDLVTAYNDAAGQTPVSRVPTELGGTTKAAGIYDSASGTFGITGTLTLDAQGDPNAVFIFKTTSTLITAGSSSVVLANGAQACNIFWQVGSSATLGANTTFKGNILALTSITLTTGASVVGRVLARNGAVTLDTNTVAKATCALPVASPAKATLHVIKTVDNVNDGTAISSDFNVHVKFSGTDVVGSPASGVDDPGTSYSLAAGTYVVSEDTNTSYTPVISGDCDLNGSVTLAAGAEKTCTITNTDIPLPAPAATPSGDGGYWAPLPLINVTKIPSPLALPSGPGSVTYSYTATNLGQVAMMGIWVKDNKCTPVTFVSGDKNKDSMLDINEAWVYSCTKTVSQTETNMATAHGQANGWDGYDTANATVIVGASSTPPLIHVEKKPNVFVLPASGGAVTYTYTVTNPGTEPLSDVGITDNKCTGLPSRVAGHPGDLNKNNLLESNEAWSFTCQTNITQTTTNIGTAIGSAHGLTAIDLSPATVAVASPKLPNTGINPDEENVPFVENTVVSPKQEQTSLPSSMRIKIPSINVDALIENVGLTPDGAMDVPKDPVNVAWFELGQRPGESGSAVIAGHYGQKNGTALAFDNLYKLRKGDKLNIEDDKGVIISFVVSEIRIYDAEADATDVFSSNDGKAHLNLVTCEGVWDKVSRSYSKRVVVFADKE
ncbi:MAG: ice-binding family protein [Candidatus Paceibacterota bacterium]|jgi:LPXTG-site transpeptidase (sortase) family protein